MAACLCVCTSLVKSSDQNTEPEAWRTRSLFSTQAPARCTKNTGVDPATGLGGVGSHYCTKSYQCPKSLQSFRIILSESQLHLLPELEKPHWLPVMTGPHRSPPSLPPLPSPMCLGSAPVLCCLQVELVRVFLLSQPQYFQVFKQVSIPTRVPTPALPTTLMTF